MIENFQECFNPIVDAASGRDLIPAMVYGLETSSEAFFRLIIFLVSFFPLSQLLYAMHRRNVRGQEFGGTYCALLIVK